MGGLHFAKNDVISVLLAETFASTGGAGMKQFLADQSVKTPVFRVITFSDNNIAFPPFEMLASTLTFTGNTINAVSLDQNMAGIFIGHRATYTGNITHSDGDNGMTLVSATEYHAEAANLVLFIA